MSEDLCYYNKKYQIISVAKLYLIVVADISTKKISFDVITIDT